MKCSRSLIILILALATTTTAATPNLEHPHAPAHVLVLFHPGKSPDDIQERALGMPDLKRMPVLPGETVDDALTRLNARPDVDFAEPDYVATSELTPTDTSYSAQWGMPKIAADRAWDSFSGSPTQKICVVDTGVDYTHPDLAGNCAPGYNAITGVNDGFDDNSHGTHCGGIIGAASNNGLGVAGVNWKVNILPCKFMSSTGSGYISDAITCLYWCQNNGATISSNSWSSPSDSSSLYTAMVDLDNQGHIFIGVAGNAAADNDGTANVTYPAKYNLPNQITVASTTTTDDLSYFSSYGATTVHLAAPGSSIYSTVLSAGYAYKSGTSMATPHVAGAVALMQAANPSLTPAGLKSKLLASVDVLSTLTGKVSTGGRLNVLNALTAAAPGIIVPPPVVSSPPPPTPIVDSPPPPSPSPLPSPPPPSPSPPPPSPSPPPAPKPGKKPRNSRKLQT